MIILNIELQNFGIYSGCHKMDLAPQKRWKKPRPIVLIGGNNGAGKSTIFEAIKLCLYGQKSLTKKISNLDYLAYLKSRINWFIKKNETTHIKIVFKLFRENIDPTKSREYCYEIIREWYYSGSTVKESFSIYQDDELLDLDSSFWQDFVEEIIPQSVINLFFFDGEKIQKLAEGSSKNLEQPIKALLNLSIIPSLSADLQILYKKYIEESQSDRTSKELKESFKKIEILEKEITKLKFDYAAIQGKINLTKSNLKNLEEKLKKAGGEFYEERDSLKKSQMEYNLIINQKKEKIAEMCGHHIPFLLAPKLLKKISLQLKKEMKISELNLTIDILSQKKKELENAVKQITKELKLDRKISNSLFDKISGYAGSWIIQFKTEKTKYSLQPNEIRQAMDALSITKERKNELSDLFKDTEKLTRDIKKLEYKIELALESDNVIKLHQEINKRNHILGFQEKESDLFDVELFKKEKEVRELNAKIIKLSNTSNKNKENLDNFERIADIRNVLLTFEKKLTERKINQLEDEIYDCYSRIHRKSGFIQKVKIDPISFKVKMFDHNQNVIPVDRLSAGEKQIYAIAVLWALSRMSGRSLPIIIDTPLGRLDTQHRTNLIQNFFSEASHQFIILFTDTEIDQNYYDRMNKNISHTYNINFNTKHGHSSINDGYLFQSNSIERG